MSGGLLDPCPAGGHKSSSTDGLAGWWKMEDNTVGQYKGG